MTRRNFPTQPRVVSGSQPSPVNRGNPLSTAAASAGARTAKSAVRCPNEPATTRQIVPERRPPHNLDQLLAELDEHDNPKENP